MLTLVEWLILSILIVGALYYAVRRVRTKVEFNAKIQECIVSDRLACYRRCAFRKPMISFSAR